MSLQILTVHAQVCPTADCGTRSYDLEQPGAPRRDISIDICASHPARDVKAKWPSCESGLLPLSCFRLVWLTMVIVTSENDENHLTRTRPPEQNGPCGETVWSLKLWMETDWQLWSTAHYSTFICSHAHTHTHTHRRDQSLKTSLFPYRLWRKVIMNCNLIQSWAGRASSTAPITRIWNVFFQDQ